MSIENLPPEMQARIAAIMAGNVQDQTPHQAAIAQPAPTPAPPPPAPVVKLPSLMDHVVALRTEVDGLKQQNAAMMQTLEAVGSAVASMFQMFQPTTGTTYSEQFTNQEQTYQEDY